MQEVIQISTDKHNGLYDISGQVGRVVEKSGIQSGFINVYVQGATAAIMIQENWDQSVQMDVINLLNKLIPAGVWLHDSQDNNGDAHLKAGIVGPSETIPVINGLSDSYHPCQILADILTLKESGLLDKEVKFTYVGDCNNVANSLIIGFLKIGIDLTIGCPEKYLPSKEIIKYIENQKDGGKVDFVFDPVSAVENADVVYTDVWLSMGDEMNKIKINELKKFQVNPELLKHAKKEVKIMHCLPAHRGQEITSEVLDSKNSIVLIQAENRLHAQKGLLVYLFSV